MARFELSDGEWALIRPLLPNKPRGVARVNDRRVLNGIFYVLRTGSPWRDLPERYGRWKTVHRRCQWRAESPHLWRSNFPHLAGVAISRRCDQGSYPWAGARHARRFPGSAAAG